MNRRILLGDDDPPARIMVARVLRAGGYDVVFAGTVEEAIAECRTAVPDLVLLDVKTPGPEGWQPFDEIRRLNPTAPVIAITTLSNQSDHADQRGIDAFLEKPLDLPLLLAVISDLLAETEERRRKRRHAGARLESVRLAA
ncbi:MAG TPA: response regulator [Verrucomicrobiae bacterium]